MIDIIYTIIPVFCVIFIGTYCKYIGLPGDDFWPLAEKITFYLLLPCLFFKSVALADFSTIALDTMVIIILATPLLVTALLYGVNIITRIDGPRFTSVAQGSIRFNNYVGIPSAVALYGEYGLTVSAVIIALLVPLTSAIVITMLNMHGNHCSSKQLNHQLWRIISNPLIIACILGFAVNQLPFALPVPFMAVVSTLSNSALAFGLLTVGAGISIHYVRGQYGVISLASVIKLIIHPLISLALCVWLDIDAVSTQLLVLYSALPPASSCYIMAKQLGGDAPLMANITAFEVLAAMITMPLMLMVAMWVAG